MTSTAWNDAEESALQGMPWPAQLLYLRCLRRHMDYSTGVVGVRRRISWQMIRETLYVEPHQGLTDSGLPSLAKVRRLMDWLIRAGLAVDQGTKERGEAIVFFLPLADRDQSVQKNPGKNPARTRQGNVGNEESTEATDFNDRDSGHRDNPGKNPARHEWAKPGTPPDSGIRIRGGMGSACGRAHEGPADPPPAPPLDFPIQEIVDAYHEVLPELAPVEKITETRMRNLISRCIEDVHSVEEWRNYFAYVRSSPFLMGKRPGTNGRGAFRADFGWLLEAENYTAIAEGKYHG